MLGAVIHPKNYILPLLRPHFCGRFPEENFMIYDAVHQAVLLHEDHKTQLLELAAPLELPPPDGAVGASSAQRAGAAVSGAVDAVLQNAGNSGAPQRKRPHDPLPQALLGRYGGDAGGIVIGFCGTILAQKPGCVHQPERKLRLRRAFLAYWGR